MHTKENLSILGITKLKEIAGGLKIAGVAKYRSDTKGDLIQKILEITKKKSPSASPVVKKTKKVSKKKRSPPVSPLSTRDTKFLGNFDLTKLKASVSSLTVTRLRELLRDAGCDAQILKSGYTKKDDLVTLLIAKINSCQGKLEKRKKRAPKSTSSSRSSSRTSSRASTPKSPPKRSSPEKRVSPPKRSSPERRKSFSKMTREELKKFVTNTRKINALSSLTKDEFVRLAQAQNCDADKVCKPGETCDLRSGYCVLPRLVTKRGVIRDKINGAYFLGSEDELRELKKGRRRSESPGIPMDDILDMAGESPTGDDESDGIISPLSFAPQFQPPPLQPQPQPQFQPKFQPPPQPPQPTPFIFQLPPQPPQFQPPPLPQPPQPKFQPPPLQPQPQPQFQPKFQPPPQPPPQFQPPPLQPQPPQPQFQPPPLQPQFQPPPLQPTPFMPPPPHQSPVIRKLHQVTRPDVTARSALAFIELRRRILDCVGMI